MTQKFIADTTEFVAAVDAATASVKELADACAEAQAAADALAASVDGISAAAKDARREVRLLQTAIAALTGKDIKITVETSGLGAAAASAAATGGGVSVGDILATAAAERTLAAATRDTAAAADVSGAAITRAWRPWWTFGATMGTFVHWAIAGTAEFLAVAIPAAVAAAAGAIVLYQGVVEGVKPHLQSLFTATEATGNMFHQTTGDVLGLGHAFQTAQNQANPIAYSLLGAYVNIARAHMADLATQGLATGRVLQGFAAKLTADFGPGGTLGGEVHDLLANGVTDLTAFGQVLGNLGHALLNFAHAMPGLAEGLLFFLTVVSKAIELISQLPAPLITAFMALEEFNRWGSLAVGVLGRLGLATSELSGSFFTFGSRTIGILSNVFKALPLLITNGVIAFGSLMREFGNVSLGAVAAGDAVKAFGEDMKAALIAAPAGWAAFVGAVAVGTGVLIYALSKVKTPMQQLVDGMQQAALKASNLQVLNVAANNLAHLGAVMDTTSRQVVAGGARIGPGIEAANPAIKTLNQGLVQQQQDMRNTVTGAQYLARTYGTDFVGALALADQAGVKLAKGITGTGTAAVQAQLQVANLVAGYKAMGAPANAIGADMTALAIQAGLANTKVSQLNSAWDQFMTNLTSGTSGLAGFEGSLANLGSGIAHVHNNLSEFAGTYSLSMRQFANSLKTFTGAGTQAWQNFNQVVGSTAPQLIDWLRTAGAEGAISGGQFSRAILEMTAQLVPFASKSATAKAEVLGLVQQAGLGIHTWAGLTSAIKNGHLSMSDLAKIIADATQKMANMSAVAKNLGTVLSSQIAAAVDQAKIKASDLTTNLNNLATAMHNGAGVADGYHGTLQPVIRSMLDLHQSIPTVAAVLQGMGINISVAGVKALIAAGHLDTTGNSAKTAGDKASTAAGEFRGMAGAEDLIHSKTIDITTQFFTIGAPPAPGIFGGNSSMVIGHRAAGGPVNRTGAYLVGEQGPELVMMRGGENVVPANRTSDILAAMASANAAGGSGHATAEIHVHAHMDSKEVFRSVQTETLRFNTRNSGSRTGKLIPGP